jgi:hypothetical protein
MRLGSHRGAVAGGGARKSMRFPVEAHAEFWWWDEKGVYRKTAGRSRNVSVRGAFVVTTVCPPVGAKVGLTVSIPDSPDTSDALRIELAGRVLRVEQSPTDLQDCGFAVLGDDVVLVRGQQIDDDDVFGKAQKNSRG